MHIETVIVGGGQAGLAMGYHLARLGRPFVILEGNPRIGDSWRNRWDSLRLFSPARYDGLPGTPFPAPRWSFPSREEFADYLEAYAKEWALPVHTGVAVRRLSRSGSGYLVETADGERYGCVNVVVASGFDHVPVLPAFASALDPGTVQVHSADYRNPGQLAAGDVLVVGAGNSGADIALELAAAGRRVVLAGRDPGQLPWRIDAAKARVLTPIVFWAMAHVLTTRTPIGRKVRVRALAHSGPLVRVKKADLVAAGVERVARVDEVRDGRPVLADGRTLDVPNVLWCTGFRPDTSWIDLPGYDVAGDPPQQRGVAEGQPGLYFVGRLFQYALSSSMIRGVGRDAAHVADHLAARVTAAGTTGPAPLSRVG